MTTVVAPVPVRTVQPEPHDVLPQPVLRWLRIARPELEARPNAIYLEGPARFKRGRLPYLPLHVRIWNRLGLERVSELEVTVLGVTLLRGFDAYVDGRGFTRVGGELSTGPEIDQGAFHVMFLETLLVPSAWPASIRWEPLHADAARVEIPFGDGTERADLRFAPDTGLPAAYTTQRYKVTGGPKVAWTAQLAAWRSFGALAYPSQLAIQWADEPQAWLRMEISRAILEPPMAEPMARARDVLAGALR
jgi:hypothetical protein